MSGKVNFLLLAVTNMLFLTFPLFMHLKYYSAALISFSTWHQKDVIFCIDLAYYMQYRQDYQTMLSCLKSKQSSLNLLSNARRSSRATIYQHRHKNTNLQGRILECYYTTCRATVDINKRYTKYKNKKKENNNYL